MTKSVKMEIKLTNGGTMPAMGKPGSAGYDIRSNEKTVIPAKKIEIVSTGVHIQIPLGYEIQVRPRSGLAAKHGITVFNSPGTIDHGYLKGIGIIMFNASDKDFHIEPGDRIAQLVVGKVLDVEFVDVDDFTSIEFDREGGFGSSGLK